MAYVKLRMSVSELKDFIEDMAWKATESGSSFEVIVTIWDFDTSSCLITERTLNLCDNKWIKKMVK